MISRCLSLAAVGFIFCTAALGQTGTTLTFYVSPQGSDKNPGTAALPFKSLTRARDAVRAAQPARQGAVVQVQPGFYQLTETLVLNQKDSGTATTPVIFQGSDRDRTFITGGMEIPADRARVVTDPAILKKLPPERTANVYAIDLHALGVTDFGVFGPRGFGRSYIPAPLEVFIDDQPLHVAQWPNRGQEGIPLGKVIVPGSDPRHDDLSNRGGVFTWNSDRPARWLEAKDLWLTGYFRYGYADDTVKIAKLDPVQKTFTTVQPHLYQYGYQNAPGRFITNWHALNLLEELDQPGEYYADSTSGLLYFIPPAGTDMAHAHIQVSLLKQPLVALENASHVIFKNITFENTRGMGVYIERGAGNRIEGCTLRNIGIVAVCIGQGSERLEHTILAANPPPSSRVLGSWSAKIYFDTAWNRNAGTDQGVLSCDLYNLGAGGVSLGGGDRRTLVPAGNFVRNCDIHDYNRLDRSYRTGVNIDGVGNIIEHNYIHEAPGGAILLHGNDHLIAYNIIARTTYDCDDMGAFYMGRDPSEQGNRLCDNFFYQNGQPDNPGLNQYRHAIYVDDEACGLLVFNNIFYQNEPSLIVLHTGNGNIFENNIFVQRGLIFDISKNVADWRADANRRPLFHERLLQSVDILKPPYSDKYPDLVKAYTGAPGFQPANKLVRNAFVNCDVPGNANNPFLFEQDNARIDDAGFVDAAHLDLDIKPDSEIFQKIPGFKPIPFDQIGPQIDQFRTSKPTHA